MINKKGEKAYERMRRLIRRLRRLIRKGRGVEGLFRY